MDLNLLELSTASKKTNALMKELRYHSLHTVLTGILPGKVLYLLEINHAHVSIDISEVSLFIKLCPVGTNASDRVLYRYSL